MAAVIQGVQTSERDVDSHERLGRMVVLRSSSAKSKCNLFRYLQPHHLEMAYPFDEKHLATRNIPLTRDANCHQREQI